MIASGSKGNACYIESNNTKIIIDCGISFKRIASFFNERNIEMDIDAMLITHEHIDHVNGLKLFGKNIGSPVYMTSGTKEGIIEKYTKDGSSPIDYNDIHIIKVTKVQDSFHARYSCKKKEYIYKINIGEYNPLERNYVFQYNKPLNIENMQKAITYFEGTHDFTSFVSSEDIRENKVRTIFKTSIKKKKDIIEISFQADGFMKYQVRNMVGLLIAVGEGKKEVNEVEKIINNKNRSQKFKTAAACGLYLNKVWY